MTPNGASGKTDGPERRCSQSVIAASEKFARQAFARSNRRPTRVGKRCQWLLRWGLPKNSLRFFFASI